MSITKTICRRRSEKDSVDLLQKLSMLDCDRAVRELRANALKQVSPFRPAHLENDSALLSQLMNPVPRHATIVPDFSERRHLPRFANPSFRNFADPLTPLAKIMCDLCEQWFKVMFTNRMHVRQLFVSLQLGYPPVRLGLMLLSITYRPATRVNW